MILLNSYKCTDKKNGFDSIEISLVVYNVIAQTALDSDKLLISLMSLKCSILIVKSSVPGGRVDQVEIRLTSATS